MKYEKGKKITDISQFKKGRKYMTPFTEVFEFSHIGKNGNPYFKDEGQGYSVSEREYNCFGFFINAGFYEAVEVTETLDDRLTDKEHQLIMQLFVGKVAEIIGFDKCTELIRECKIDLGLTK